MKISYTKVTWYSQLAAIIIFIAIYFLGFYVGRQYEMVNGTPVLSLSTVSPAVPMVPANPNSSHTDKSASAASALKILNNVTFNCPNPSGTYVAAQFLQNSSGKGLVDLELSDGRAFSLPQTLSADGARYANADESFVFWNKGNGAFIQENGTTTYTGCVTK